MQTHERLGHGYILKKSKLVGSWLVDPFVLRTAGGTLIVDRTTKRISLKKDKAYILHNLHVSDIRCLTDVEYHAMKNASEFADRLADDFSITNARCFDATFSHETNDKSLVIVAPFRENVEKLHKIMRENVENMKQKNSDHGLSVDDILGPTKQNEQPMLVTPMLSYIFDDKNPAHLSTVVEEDH
jgi:hypothetical protein